MDTRLLKSLMEKKPNETATNRLESLRLPRDLSLGGTKPKKTFEPNLNFTRAKHRTKESIKKVESKKKEKPKPQPRKKIVDTTRFVQSKGVFSEGSAFQKRATGFSDRVKYENDAPTSMAIPTYRKNESVIDHDTEDNVLANLTDLKSDEYASYGDVWNFSHASYDFKVKKEGLDPYFCKLEDTDNTTRLALIKMPESLACKGLSDDPNNTKISDYHLNMMTEGKIGSLQITRSGKMYMKIGNMKYIMESIDTMGGPESIATYMEPNDSNKAKFAILGDVEGRFELTPQWNELWK